MAQFQRFTPVDAAAHERQIVAATAALHAAQSSGDPVALLEAAGMLGALLTGARREAEANALLSPHVRLARDHPQSEPAGWLLLALATNDQYLGQHEGANAVFDEALQLARANGWDTLQHFILHHWGRSWVEQGDRARARDCFTAALALRERLAAPRFVDSTRRALAAIDAMDAMDAAADTTRPSGP